MFLKYNGNYDNKQLFYYDRVILKVPEISFCLKKIIKVSFIITMNQYIGQDGIFQLYATCYRYFLIKSLKEVSINAK